MTKIDKEAVERLSRTMNRYGNHWKVGNDFSEQRAADCDRAADTLRALRAALDAAEARERVYQQFSHALLCDDANWATAIFCEHDFLRDFVDTLSPDPPIQERHALAEYAEKVRAEERERCAKIAEDHRARDMWEAIDAGAGYSSAARDIATAIRQETNDN
jgi:hypothetical protein